MAQPVQVLFVDDEDNIIKSLRRLCLDEDFEVLTATSGEEGLDIINSSVNLGLIVSDQRMPGLTGVDFLEQARKLVPDAIRIVLTGYADIEAAMGAINRGGASRYLTKPWSDDDLLQNLREAVKLFGLKHENVRLSEVVKEQNRVLAEWNSRLKSRVLKQTQEIVARNVELDRLNGRLKKNFNDSTVVFANLMELRDRASRSHSKYVAEMSVRIAQDLGLSQKETETIHTAALLHDIGKIGISDELLRQDPRNRTEAEQEEYMLHGVRGQAAIDDIEDLQEAGLFIRYHHEWFDGQGRPEQLSHNHIPLGARIICLADFVDRNITCNPSKKMVSEVLAKVEHEAGKMFDPDLTPLLAAHLKEIYGEAEPLGEKIEVSLKPGEILPGMVLAKKVVSGTGLLLIDKGSVLTDRNIHSLQRYYFLDAPKEDIWVWG